LQGSFGLFHFVGQIPDMERTEGGFLVRSSLGLRDNGVQRIAANDADRCRCDSQCRFAIVTVADAYVRVNFVSVADAE